MVSYHDIHGKVREQKTISKQEEEEEEAEGTVLLVLVMVVGG